jgi:hypothetical protein
VAPAAQSAEQSLTLRQLGTDRWGALSH